MRDDDERRLAELIAAAQWKKMTPKLLAYALYCLARQGGDSGTRAKSAQDHVTQAVYEVLSGKHSPHELGDLFPLLCAVIATRIRSNAAA